VRSIRKIPELSVSLSATTCKGPGEEASAGTMQLVFRGSTPAPGVVRRASRRTSAALEGTKRWADFERKSEPRGRVSQRPRRARSPFPTASLRAPVHREVVLRVQGRKFSTTRPQNKFHEEEKKSAAFTPVVARANSRKFIRDVTQNLTNKYYGKK
jgi:hypothetical protein